MNKLLELGREIEDFNRSINEILYGLCSSLLIIKKLCDDAGKTEIDTIGALTNTYSAIQCVRKTWKGDPAMLVDDFRQEMVDKAFELCDYYQNWVRSNT